MAEEINISAITKALKSWETLNAVIQKMSEEECAAMLKLEKKTARRQTFLIRIYGRFNVLRSKRERAELMGG